MKRNKSMKIGDFFFAKKKSEDNENSSLELLNAASSSSTSLSDFSLASTSLQSPEATSFSLTLPPSDLENDISVFVVKELNILQKLDAFQKVFRPNEDFVFPKSTDLRNLRFQYSWLHKFKWLSYSKIKDGAFCKFCVLFGPRSAGKGNQELKQIVTEPFRNWKKSLDSFRSHENLEYHKKSLLDYESASLISEHKQSTIDIQLNKQKKAEIETNRRYLKPIIETILVCGRQGLALRGHRDDGRIDLETEPEDNDGNFRSLLRFKARDDEELCRLFKVQSARNTYTSKTTQNMLIEVCNSLILGKLISEIKESKFFSILVDDTTDVSTQEKMSFCVRIFNTKVMCIKELFLQFYTVHDLTGKGLASQILKVVEELGLDPKNIRGQGYDGAASMSGEFNGVKAHILQKYPLAKYVHCAAHVLNLAISECCNIKQIKHCMGIIQKVCSFFNSPKRNAFLQEKISSDPNKNQNPSHQKLKQLCATRWTERHDSVHIFLELFDFILIALQEISSSWNSSETSSMAFCLWKSMKNIEFVIALLTINTIFSFSSKLCKYLQSSTIDLCEAVSYAKIVVEKVEEIRLNADQEFTSLYKKAEQIAEKYDMEIKLPRHAKQISDNPEIYYRTNIFVNFLDHFILQMNERFLKHEELLSNFQFLLSPSPLNDDNKIHLINILKTYETDLQCTIEELSTEYEIWQKKVTMLNRPLKNAEDALKNCNPIICEHIFTILRIFATLPVSTCENERSFSMLKRVKTYLRNTTSENRLNGLALLNVCRDLTPSVDDILLDLSKNKDMRLTI